MIRYAKINKNDIANGLGVRVSLFVTGCNIKCPGCHNKEIQDFHSGKPFTMETLYEIYDALSPDYISGLSILGGEPLDPANIGTVYRIICKVQNFFKENNFKKDIWLWTGYTLEELQKRDEFIRVPQFIDAGGIYEEIPYNHIFAEMMSKYLINVLIDGPFEIDKKDITLKFRGSWNQNIYQNFDRTRHEEYVQKNFLEVVKHEKLQK